MIAATINRSGFLQRVLASVSGFTGFAADRYASDATQVFDMETFDQLIRTARPMRVNVNESARVMEHTVESGATIVDHRIINPVEVRIDMLLMRDEYRATYATIKNLFNQGKLLGVQTRTSTHQNMLISGLPQEEDAELFDVLPLTLTLIEVKFVQSAATAISASQASAPQYVDTTNSGRKNPISIGAPA